MAVPDVLIRGLSAHAIARLDREADALGLSRNEYLRRKLEPTDQPPMQARTTAMDLWRAAIALSDLLDPEIMNAAWRRTSCSAKIS